MLAVNSYLTLTMSETVENIVAPDPDKIVLAERLKEEANEYFKCKILKFLPNKK